MAANLPALPPKNSTDWYAWAQALHAAASTAAQDGDIGTPGTTTGDALRAASVSSFDGLAAFRGLKAALTEGYDDVAVGLIGDSTGDAVDEWFYLLASYIAPLYPAFTVQHRLWNDTTQLFAAPTTLQSGTGGVQRAAVLAATGTTVAVGYTAPSIVGDLDLTVYCKAPSWKNGTQTFASKFGNSGDRSFRFQINASGFLIFDWTTDGTTLQTAASSGVAVPFADGAAGWVRVQLDVDAGAANHTIKFFTSTDGVTWTQLGATTTRTTGTTSVFNSAYDYQLGARTGASEPIVGGARIYEALIRDGIDGPTIAPRLATLWGRGTGTGVATVEGAPVLTFVNGSQPGAGIAYLGEATRVKKLTPDFGQAVQFFSDGHNELATVGNSWASLLASWVPTVLGRLSLAAPVLLTQNPRVSPAANIAEEGMRRRQLISWARQRGYSVIDTYKAFLDDGRSIATLINSDGIHPTQVGGGGQSIWLAMIKAAFTACP